MQFLFVRIVRARDLQLKTVNGISDPFVEIRIGNYKATTKYFEKKPNLEWNQVFAFTRDRMQAAAVEITWYKLEDKNGVNVGRGELMLAIWFGTQADDVFPDAWHSDASIVSGESLLDTRSKVYLSPRLWYLRVNIIQAQDLVPTGNKNRRPEVYVKALLGDVILRTKVSPDKNVNPKWNEDLMFVVAEPFGDPLILSVEDKLGNNMVECLGRYVIRLSQVDQRLLPLPAASKWYNLEKIVFKDGRRKELNFFSKLNMRITLDGGYHVFDESIRYGSVYRPTAKKLWTSIIGILELGIISASSLQPTKLRNGRETTDAYCVAKYGPKWLKTRTVVDSFSPKWNEQYTLEVYDPYTVVTIGVFDDCHLHSGDVVGGGKDLSIGKVRIRLSTLSTDKIYTYSYPLLMLQPNGVKKMGEIQLAMWSLRKCKANFERLLATLKCFLDAWKWFDQIRRWKNPTETIIVISLYCFAILQPDLILPTLILYCLQVGICRWRKRPRHPTHIDVKLSLADSATSDELDEEFDTFPSSRQSDVRRMRLSAEKYCREGCDCDW
ncbi:hypothetical protein CRYUN_Cryun09bG0132600 [Craigia yunnanensis]